jgi:ribosomal-protein-alanine N-acetyltransferase
MCCGRTGGRVVETALRLRPLRFEDHATIALWIADATACLRWAGPRLDFPFVLADFAEQLVAPGGTSYSLAEGDGAPCGFGQHWVLTPGMVHLGRVIVAPGVRGAGLGRILCEQLIEAAVASTRAAAVTLRVYRDNLPALALYRRLGFEAVDAESTEDVLFMRARV